MFGILHFAYATFRMTTFPRTTALCHSEPTPSRVLCRTRLFGHSRGAKEENKVNRDLWSSVRNPYLPHLWPEILPPCCRQNDMHFQGRQPFVIPSEAGRPTRNLHVISNACERSLTITHSWQEILQGKAFQNDIHLAKDSSLRLRYVQNDIAP